MSFDLFLTRLQTYSIAVVTSFNNINIFYDIEDVFYDYLCNLILLFYTYILLKIILGKNTYKLNVYKDM